VLGADAAARPAPAAMNLMAPEDASLEIRVLDVARGRELPSEFAGGFPVFQRYVEVNKLHLHDGEPFGMMRIFVADEAFAQFGAAAIRSRKILRMLMNGDARYAFELEQTMTVEPADFVLSGHLGYAFGSPVARIMRRVYGEDRRLAYAGASWYRGDQFAMRTVLPRALVVESPPALIAPSPRVRTTRMPDEIRPARRKSL
jgi:GntR family transcriptional regulator